MKTIVIGCGQIGRSIVSSLTGEGYDVTAVDTDPQAVEQIANIYDVMTLCGSGTDCDALEEAGVSDCDLFIACATSDELNMLSCFLARRMGAKHTIARIRNPENNDSSLSFMKQQLDLSLAINPEQLAAQEAINILKFPAAVKIEHFSRRNFEMIEVRLSPDSILDGLTLRQMREKYNAGYLISAVQRGEEVFIPDGNFVLHSGDKIGITASPPEAQKLMKLLGLSKKQPKSVMIYGIGKASYYLAKGLLGIGISVKVISKDRKLCEEFSALLPDAIVLHASDATQETLLEEGLADTDAFVALTERDEDNLITSISVFLQNVPNVITRLDKEELCSLAAKIGLDCVITPTDIASNIVVRYARALENTGESKVETLYKLMDGKAEALEFKVGDDSPILGVPLKDVKFKKNILIAGILRNRKVIIPSGFDSIQAGDNIVVLAAGRRIQSLSEILD